MSLPTPALTTDPRGLIFITPDMYADMAEWHRIAAEIRRDEPVMRVEAEGWPAFWAITKHADVFEVSRRSDVFWNTEKSAPGPDLQYDMLQAMGIELPRTLVHIHGDAHQKLRNVTNDWFKPAAVKGLQPAIDAIADEYADRLLELGGECDLATDLAVPFTLRVIMSIFGVPQSDERLMLELTQGLFGAADPEYLGDFSDPLASVQNSIRKFESYFDELTASRQAHPTDDLATVIANGMVGDEPMGERERLWYYIIVATAGHDTTSFAFSGGMEQLLRHPAGGHPDRRRDDPRGGRRVDVVSLGQPGRGRLRAGRRVRHHATRCQQAAVVRAGDALLPRLTGGSPRGADLAREGPGAGRHHRARRRAAVDRRPLRQRCEAPAGALHAALRINRRRGRRPGAPAARSARSRASAWRRGSPACGCTRARSAPWPGRPPRCPRR